jgi:hypothetical protein
LGQETTEDDIEQVLESFPHVVDKARVALELLQDLAQSRCCA